MTEGSTWISHSPSFTADLHPETNHQSLEINAAQTQNTTYTGQLYFVVTPISFQPIDPQKAYYNYFILKSQRSGSLWQRIPWSLKVMLCLSIIAINICVSDKHACCSGTPWLCLHGDSQAGSEWVRFRTGSDVAMVLGLTILLSRGYSQPFSLSSQHNSDASILFLWAKLSAALQINQFTLSYFCYWYSVVLDGQSKIFVMKNGHLNNTVMLAWLTWMWPIKPNSDFQIAWSTVVKYSI